MTKDEMDQRALVRCCCGNQEAIGFLQLWRNYVHDIDDLVDGDRSGPEFMLSTYAQAIFLYSHPFYLKNLQALRQIALNCTNAYADSVAWERSPEAWRREFADSYRHFGAEMVIAVATICGGYEHARSISPELRVICYFEHHDASGNPV